MSDVSRIIGCRFCHLWLHLRALSLQFTHDSLLLDHIWLLPGWHAQNHTSIGVGSGPSKACPLFVFSAHPLCACMCVCVRHDFALTACECKIKDKAVDVRENRAGVRGVLLSSWPSCWSLWKVWKCFWWNQWKQSVLKGGAATHSLWAGKYVRTGAHLSQNRRHCTPLSLVFYPSADFSFVRLLFLVSPPSLFWSVTPSFLSISLFFSPLFFCLLCFCPTSISLLKSCSIHPSLFLPPVLQFL